MKVLAIIFLLCIQVIPLIAQEGPISSSSLPPAPTPLGQEDFCWVRIGDCINENVNNTGSDPRFDPSSPLFNVTEFLCCPLVQQVASAEKPCFCTVTSFLEQNPFQVRNVTLLLTTCNIVGSIASLDSFCLGAVPSPATAPVMPPPGGS